LKKTPDYQALLQRMAVLDEYVLETVAQSGKFVRRSETGIEPGGVEPVRRFDKLA